MKKISFETHGWLLRRSVRCNWLQTDRVNLHDTHTRLNVSQWCFPAELLLRVLIVKSSETHTHTRDRNNYLLSWEWIIAMNFIKTPFVFIRARERQKQKYDTAGLFRRPKAKFTLYELEIVTRKLCSCQNRNSHASSSVIQMDVVKVK